MAPVVTSNVDGSWGYVVCVAAFMVQFVVFGIAVSFGVYNIALLEHFQSSVAATSMIGALNIGLLLGGGPLASYLMRKMSYRKVSFLGSFLSSVGLLLCPFAPNIIYLDVFYGVVTGIGFCLVYVPSHTLSGLYFDKHRSLATGLVTSGSGLGGVVFPYISHFLITEYGWMGSMFIISAINMNNFVFAALLLPVPVSRKPKDAVQRDELVVMLTCTADEAQVSRQNRSTQNKTGNINHTSVEIEPTSNSNENFRANSLDGYLRRNSLEPNLKINSLEHNLRKNSDENLRTTSEQNLRTNSMTHSELLRTDSLEKNLKTNTEQCERETDKEVKNCYVLCNFVFLIYCINNIFWNMGLSLVFVLGPEYFTEFGLTVKESTICLMCFNATIIVGGVFGGGVGNLRCVSRMALYITANFSTGVFILLLALPFTHTFLGVCLDMLSMGMVFGIILGLLVVVTADILGAQALGDGMGYLLFANGIGNTVGPPIGGWIKDVTGSCTLAFYMAGSVTLVGGGIMMIAPVWEYSLSKFNHQGSRDESLKDTGTSGIEM
ncbi:monocarboxylate transporter 14-like [Ylistrum balloti]|uniref:monocarboxylate transporter 14-like n=1 Tax=Ylistrum balloti TaxID=509963 RepID=UPI002905CFDB|nr:monocarboxylate transporter 14-like [Ylistrum balloti]XP_060065648.1 monocarboxylate transporter 14-like [Ylistrum balloti]